MDDREKEYEAEYEQFKEENEKCLKIFREDMTQEGLDEETIRKHYDNVEFYLNIYNLRDGGDDMKTGCSDIIEHYLGYYFITKCDWASPGAIRETAGSIQKFYRTMLEHGLVEQEDFETLCEVIDEGIAGWQELCLFKNIDPRLKPL